MKTEAVVINRLWACPQLEFRHRGLRSRLNGSFLFL